MQILTYSIKEAATASGVGRTMLYQLIKDGELRTIKIGRRTLILRRDLEELLERRRSHRGDQW